METSPLKSFTYANKSKMIFINLSLERRRGGLSPCLEIHVRFTQHASLQGDFSELAGPRSVPGSTRSPPAHHLASRVPFPRAPAPCLQALPPWAGGGAPAGSSSPGDSRAARKKNALCLPGALPEPGASSQRFLAGFLRSRCGLGCSWSARGGGRGGGQRAPGPEADCHQHVPRSADAVERGAGPAATPAARGGGPTRAQNQWVTRVLKPCSVGVQARLAWGSLCSSSASLREPRKKRCVGRRGCCVTQREAGGAGR